MLYRDLKEIQVENNANVWCCSSSTRARSWYFRTSIVTSATRRLIRCKRIRFDTRCEWSRCSTSSRRCFASRQCSTTTSRRPTSMASRSFSEQPQALQVRFETESDDKESPSDMYDQSFPLSSLTRCGWRRGAFAVIACHASSFGIGAQPAGACLRPRGALHSHRTNDRHYLRGDEPPGVPSQCHRSSRSWSVLNC